jgi:hypothetical protein
MHLRFLAVVIGLALIQIQTVFAQREARPVDPQWQTMVLAVREAIMKASFAHPEFAGIDNRAIGIDTTVDITGDGVPEALVHLGPGGASTDQFTVMRIEAHKPVIAVFRDRNGKTAPMVFLQGSSVMHSDSVKLLPAQHAVYAFHFNYGPTGKLHECGGEAYGWNDHTKAFDYSSRLSEKITKESCRQVPQTAA